MSVVPFRKPKKKPDPTPPKSDSQEPERCPRCGWTMPAVVKVDKGAVKGQLLLYIDCPECGANLILLVEFV